MLGSVSLRGEADDILLALTAIILIYVRRKRRDGNDFRSRRKLLIILSGLMAYYENLTGKNQNLGENEWVELFAQQ